MPMFDLNSIATKVGEDDYAEYYTTSLDIEELDAILRNVSGVENIVRKDNNDVFYPKLNKELYRLSFLLRDFFVKRVVIEGVNYYAVL